MNRLAADPERLVSMGNNVGNITNDYIVETKKIFAVADRIKSAWNDEVSNTYIRNIMEYKADFDKLGQVIGQLSEIMKKHGNRLISSRDKLNSMAENI